MDVEPSTNGDANDVVPELAEPADSQPQQTAEIEATPTVVEAQPVANIARAEDNLEEKDDSATNDIQENNLEEKGDSAANDIQEDNLEEKGDSTATDVQDTNINNMDSPAAPAITSEQGEANDVTVDQDLKPDTVQEKKASKEAGTFSLGVPGLKFSSNNVKTSKDGTKMVQIHQSQITPEQLQALQSNPNIKVVFRHVPSGKSYIKPPKHMLPGHSLPGGKRKSSFMEEELEGPDVYSFDEGEDFEAPAKKSKLADARARYSYGGIPKKKGRPRIMPDPSTYTASFMAANRHPTLPSTVILTDLLARVNNPNAKKEVKLHTSQTNAEVLANMELNPAYRIVLTTKQELPPLVIESVDAEEQAKLENDAADIEMREKEQAVNRQEDIEEDMEEDVQQEEEDLEEQRRLEEEREKAERKREAARLKRLADEEEELKKAAMQTKTSRSGRIRKPSRYSLDIARLTKRKSSGLGGDSSADESELDVSALKKFPKPTATTPTPGRGRGRPRKKPIPVSPEDPEKEEEKAETAPVPPKEEKAEDAPVAIKEEENAETTGVTPKEEEKEEAATVSSKEPEKGEEKVAAAPALPEDLEKEEEKAENESERKEEEEVVEKEATGAESKSGEDSEKMEAKDEQAPEDGKQDATPVSTEPDQSTDATDAESKAEATVPEDAAAADEAASAEPDETEDPEVIDNRYRLRKLLHQCSTEEIRSVLLPEAFDSINIGDFLLYKAGQIHNSSGKISFPQLYKEFEGLHKDAVKEATRYNTLVRRANKIGGDKRMEKIVLMPVYNVDAANSLEISNSSIDAQICGIQRTITTEMIAANSFFLKTKMESPLIRLKFPEVTGPKQPRLKPKRPLYSNQYQQQEPDSTTPDKPKPKPQKRQVYGQKISSMRFTTFQGKNNNSESGIQVRRPAYIEQLKSTGQITLAGQNHQLSAKTQENILQRVPANSAASLLKADVQSSQMVASATHALAQLQATVDQQRQQATASTTANAAESVAIYPTTGQTVGTADTTLVTSDAAGQAEQFLVTEEGAADAETEGEVRKHLVPIGDGQYVELPEGYSIIQTDEGYIIGQPGSTFAQGEDGNVYITNSDGSTTEISQGDISGAGEAVVVSQGTES